MEDQMKVLFDLLKAKQRIAEAGLRTIERDPKYWKGIVDRTGRGSEWSVGPEEVKALLLKAEPAEPPEGTAAPGCSYYVVRGEFGNTIGMQNILVVGRDMRGLLVRKGAHGPELVTRTYGNKTSIPATSGWLILGPDDSDGKEIVWTAYPGDMTRMADQKLLEKILGDAQEAPVPEDQVAQFKGCAAKLIE